MLKPEDYIGPPCGCAACVVAGVSEQESRRDPRSGVWMHGRDLANWYRAKATFDAEMARIRVKGMR